MARVKYGALVVEIKGRMGGTMLQGGRSGGVIKNGKRGAARTVAKFKAGAGTAIGKAQRKFSTITKAWASLTSVERDSWTGLIGVWIFKNKFGDIYSGTGFQIFTAFNNNRLILGEGIINTAPVKLDAFDYGFILTDYSISSTFDINLINAAANNQYVSFYFSRPQAETRNVGNTPINFAFAEQLASPQVFDIKSQYDSWLGYVPPLGSFIYVKVWTADKKYPSQQFLQVFKAEVVA